MHRLSNHMILDRLSYYSQANERPTNDSGHITPGIMFTVKELHLTSVQSALKVPLSSDKK